MKKLSRSTVLMYAVYTAMCLLSATLSDGAFAFGIFVGATYAANPIVVCVIYLGSSLLGGATSLMHAGVRAAVIMTAVCIHKLVKRKIGKGALLLYTLLANVFYVAYRFDGYGELARRLLCVALGIAFAYVCIYVFRAVFVRGVDYKPALDERICIVLFGVVASYCLSKYTLWGLAPVYFVAPFAVLFCVSALDDKTAFVCAATVGIGNLLATGGFECCVFCVASALAAVALSKVHRLVGAVSVVAVDVVLSYFFNIHGTFDTIVFLPTALSVLVFVCIPGKAYKYLKDCFYGSAETYLARSVSQKTGVALARRLYRLSDIFLSMRNAFYSVSNAQVTVEQAENGIVRQVAESVCRDCNLRSTCWRQNLQDTEQSLLSMTVCAVKRGKCSILDVPQSLGLRCERVSGVISEINSQAKSYTEYVAANEQTANNRTLLGDQMGGVSGLLLQLASDCKSKAVSDSDKETELVDRLVFHNVKCIGATVLQQGGNLSVFVTVASGDVANDVIEQVTSAVVNQPMIVDKTEPTESAGWTNVILAAKPRYRVTYGISSVAKSGSNVSGDTYSVLTTDNGKCIVALCDGMGSGARAEEMSATSISLVESFYRAGFDNDTILSCVNKLLTSCGNEVFCAVDMVVLDMYNGLADFIKLGAPAGVVRCGDEVEIVNGSSLPLGVLEEMRPSVTKMAFNCGDCVVLMTDGVTDCFRDVNAVAQIVTQSTLTNPQSMAEEIMQKAQKICKGKPADDMTILVCKIS